MDKEHKSEVTTEKEHRDISWLFTYRSMLNIICMATTLMVFAKALAIQFGLIEIQGIEDISRDAIFNLTQQSLKVGINTSWERSVVNVIGVVGIRSVRINAAGCTYIQMIVGHTSINSV